jgi:hypothetical protein
MSGNLKDMPPAQQSADNLDIRSTCLDCLDANIQELKKDRPDLFKVAVNIANVRELLKIMKL